MVQISYFQDRIRDTDVENRPVDTEGKVEGGMKTEKATVCKKHCMGISLHMFSEKTRNNNMNNHEAQIKLTNSYSHP